VLIGSRIVLRDISTKSIVTLLTEDRDPPFISILQRETHVTSGLILSNLQSELIEHVWNKFN
jgi:hypothetical protein